MDRGGIAEYHVGIDAEHVLASLNSSLILARSLCGPPS